MRERLFELIESYDIITIFHHVNADGDALGSQYGLLHWIKEQYPQKNVYALGEDNSSIMHLFPKHDKLTDEVIAESLAIIVDTSNSARIDDKRAFSAKCTFRLDHHISVEQFTDYEIVSPNISSTCQLIAMLLKQHTEQALSETVSRYLYYGMVTDTISFSVSSVDALTLETAAYLVSSGIDVSVITNDLFTVSKKLFQFKVFLMEQVCFLENIAYIRIKQDDVKRFEISSNQAKECITLLNNIEGIATWCLFIEDEKRKDIFNVSLRSRGVGINEIAGKYGGGGHKFASGIKGLDNRQTQLLLDDLLKAFSSLKSQECTCTDECASGYNPNCSCIHSECHCTEAK